MGKKKDKKRRELLVRLVDGGELDRHRQVLLDYLKQHEEFKGKKCKCLACTEARKLLKEQPRTEEE